MRTRARLLTAATGVLLWGCEPSALPEPAIVSLEPAQVQAHTPTELRVHYDALLPLAVDYTRESAPSAMAAMKVYIGEQLAPIQRFERPSTVIVSVPADIPAGEHDVRLVLSDGRETRRTQRLVVSDTVNTLLPGTPCSQDAGQPKDAEDSEDSADSGTPELYTGPGSTERSGLSGFRFDTVGAQVRDEPFTLVIHAEGSKAAGFQGTVTLSSSKGTITPSVAGPFSDGVVKVQVTLSQPSPQVITAEDANGVTGSSNEFSVRPH